MMYLVLRHGQTENNQANDDDIYCQSEMISNLAEAESRYDYRVIIEMRKQKTIGAVSLYEVAEYNRETGAFVLGPMLRHEAAKLKTIVRYNLEKAVQV